METNKFISLKVVIDRIMMSPLYLGLKFDAAIMWAVDVINLIESPEFFIEKTDKVFVEDYRGRLPYDYVAIIKVNIVEQLTGITTRQPMKTASDPYLKGYPKRTSVENKGIDNTYRIEGDYIYTGLEKGVLEVAYKALPVDGDNYIMIPDNTFIILAVQNYIQWQYLKILWELDEIGGDKVEKAEQNYTWSVGQAQSQRQFDNLDKLESVKNAVSRLILLRDNHETDYRYSTHKEYRRI